MLNLNTIIVTEAGKATKVVLTDNTNYASMGITASSVRGVVTIRQPNGTILYENENIASNPDILYSTSNTKTVVGNVEVENLNGNWLVTYTIQHSGGSQEQSFSHTANNFKAYPIAQDFVVDCANAALQSIDNTNYNALNISQVTTETYTHALSSKTSGVLNGTTALVTQKFPTLFNEIYTASIVAQNLYTFSPQFAIRYIAKGKFTYQVECKIDTCDVVCCMECLRQKMFDAQFKNPALFEELQEKFIYTTSLLQLYQAEINCGNHNGANELAKQIHEITGCSNGCDACSCTNGNQVRPELLPCSGSSGSNTPCPPCNYFGNAVISGQVQKQCPPPQVGTYVTVTIPANTVFNSTQSAAQSTAQRLFDAEKQSIANAQGTCQETCTPSGGTATTTLPCCSGLVLQGTTCQTTCNAGFTPINGVCQVNCASAGQAPSSARPCCVGLVNQDGICQTACSSGFSPTNGVCTAICGAANQPPHPTFGCCSGLLIQNNICVTACSSGFAGNAQGVCTPLCSSVGAAPHPTYGCCAGLVIQDGVCQAQCNAGFAPDGNGVCVQSCATNGQTNTLPCCNGLKTVWSSPIFLPTPPPSVGDGICVSCLTNGYIARPKEYTPSDIGAGINYYDLPCCNGLHRYRYDWQSTAFNTACTATCSSVIVAFSGQPFTYNSEPTADTYGSICVPCAGNGQIPITWNGQPKCCSGFVFDSGTNTCIPA